jgi:2-oxoglutarate ferredoxin oxidoreductase subunit alpha
VAEAEQEFVPYRVSAPDEVPPMSAIGGPHIVRFTTSTHDEHGQLSKSPAQVRRLNERLAAKVEAHLDEIAMVKTDLQEGADTLLVSYGVTARAAEEAVKTAREMGKCVSALVVYSLWPVPEREIREAMIGVRRVVVPELNLGQYQREIQRLAADGVEVIGIYRVDGELISPKEIEASL